MYIKFNNYQKVRQACTWETLYQLFSWERDKQVTPT